MKLVLIWAVLTLVCSASLVWLMVVAVKVLEELEADGYFADLGKWLENFTEYVSTAIVRLIERK